MPHIVQLIIPTLCVLQFYWNTGNCTRALNMIMNCTSAAHCAFIILIAHVHLIRRETRLNNYTYYSQT